MYSGIIGFRGRKKGKEIGEHGPIYSFEVVFSRCSKANPKQEISNTLEGDRLESERLTRPSNSPSPVVAQLGTTYQILSFS